MLVTGSGKRCPTEIALMYANGAYGSGKEKLSRPLISPDWKPWPAIVARANMSARSIGVGSPSARSSPTPFIDVTFTCTNFVVPCSELARGDREDSRRSGWTCPNSGISDWKSPRKYVRLRSK